VGVTAGASAPKILVDELIARLKALGAQRVVEMDGELENVRFSVPKALLD
jgi:4-hydroxy-3-methylbut-2-en-1-yl diphosphate reductase